MRRLLLIMAVLAAAGASASGASRGDSYSVTALAVYGWNKTRTDHGGLDLQGHLPFCRHFETDLAFETGTARVTAIGAVLRPKLPLPVGELFADFSVHDRLFSKERISELVLSASAGYRMDYVSAQVGVLSRRVFDRTGQSASVAEPAYFLYRVAVNVRPSTSRWNIGLGAGNYNEYQYERSWQPIFFLGGRYDCSSHITVLLRAELKPSGIFSQTTNFWGAAIRAGVTYRF